MRVRDVHEARLLMVDDEPELRRMLLSILHGDGYADVHEAATAAEALEKARQLRPDAVILDVMLPDGDGFSLLRELRAFTQAPVLFLSARDEDEARLRGLGLGADDYITKPFSPSVLVARIKAHLAQYDRLKQAGGVDRNQLQLGSVLLQKDARRVFVDGAEVALKNKEYALLRFLLSNPDIVFSKETLYERIWGYDAMGDNATVVVYINRLREKIEKDPSHPRYIQTVWGAGYRFKP